VHRQRGTGGEEPQGRTGHIGGLEGRVTHRRLTHVLDHPSDGELRRHLVLDARVPPRARRAAAVQRRRDARRQAGAAAGEAEAVGVAPEAVGEHVALVAEGEAARIEPQRELAQPAGRAGVAHGQIEVQRSFLEAAEAGGIHPQRARVGDVGGMEVERGPVRRNLSGRHDGHEQQRTRQSGRLGVRPSAAHYGNTVTVVRVT